MDPQALKVVLPAVLLPLFMHPVPSRHNNTNKTLPSNPLIHNQTRARGDPQQMLVRNQLNPNLRPLRHCLPNNPHKTPNHNLHNHPFGHHMALRHQPQRCRTVRQCRATSLSKPHLPNPTTLPLFLQANKHSPQLTPLWLLQVSVLHPLPCQLPTPLLN